MHVHHKPCNAKKRVVAHILNPILLISDHNKAWCVIDNIYYIPLDVNGEILITIIVFAYRFLCFFLCFHEICLYAYALVKAKGCVAGDTPTDTPQRLTKTKAVIPTTLVLGVIGLTVNNCGVPSKTIVSTI